MNFLKCELRDPGKRAVHFGTVIVATGYLQIPPRTRQWTVFNSKAQNSVISGREQDHEFLAFQICSAARMAALVAFNSFATSRVSLPNEWVIPPPDAGPLLDTLTIALGTAHEPTAQWKADRGKMALGDAAYAKQTWWADQLGDMARIRLSQIALCQFSISLLGESEIVKFSLKFSLKFHFHFQIS